MLIFTAALRRALLLFATGFVLSACQTDGPAVSVSEDNPGFEALANGDYTKAQRVFEAMLVKSPHDPYIELNLGLAYQGTGRTELAEQIYREAMIDGKYVHPEVTMNPGDAGKSVAQIACQNLRLALKSPDACEPPQPAPLPPSPSAPLPLPPPLPPPAVRTFIVFFDLGKADLTAEGYSVIDEAVTTAKSNGFAKVVITGHADTTGSNAYNEKLSFHRAQAVEDEMIAEGIDGSQISIAGEGIRAPLVPTAPGVQKPENRRAVIDLGN